MPSISATCRCLLAKRRTRQTNASMAFQKPSATWRASCAPGNARKFRQSTAGRRNALGCVLNPRDNQWLSGTMHAFTLMFMGNSHTGINFRIPLLPETHDPACERNCLETNTLQRLQRRRNTSQDICKNPSHWVGKSCNKPPSTCHISTLPLLKARKPSTTGKCCIECAVTWNFAVPSAP